MIRKCCNKCWPISGVPISIFFERRAKFPRFKTKKRSRPAFRIQQRVSVAGERVYVPSVGWVRIRQSQAIEFPTKSATFKRSAAGHWFVMLVVEFEVPTTKAPAREEEAAGFDMVLQPLTFWWTRRAARFPLPDSIGPGRENCAGRRDTYREQDAIAAIAPKRGAG